MEGSALVMSLKNTIKIMELEDSFVMFIYLNRMGFSKGKIRPLWKGLEAYY
jgi:hypothetical protein